MAASGLSMANPAKPSYDLDELKELIKDENTTSITYNSRQGAYEAGFSWTEIRETVLSLRSGDFYKTMPAKRYDNVWQDVYKPCRNGIKLYVKLQKSPNDKCVGISFKKA